jgi:nucleolar pre-ribosomal-associated protein 1
MPVLRALLAPQSSRKLNAHLNSAQTDLVLVALKLWNAMSDYASGAEKKNVYEAFQWGNKVGTSLNKP